jgi:hypothetical protein
VEDGGQVRGGVAGHGQQVGVVSGCDPALAVADRACLGGEAGHGGQGSELRIPAAVATLLGGVVNAWLFLLRVTR